MTDINEFVERYVNIWNEPDVERRRQAVRALWQKGARHLARTLEPAGHALIEERVATAYQKWVKEKGYVFRLRDCASHHDAIRVRWEMLPAADKDKQGAEVISIGLDLLLLGDDGRIRAGYQFIEA